MLQIAREELALELSGSRVAVVGFPITRANKISQDLQSVGCVSNHLTAPCAPEKLEIYDVVLVCLAGNTELSSIADLTAISQPVLFTIESGAKETNAGFYLHPDDLLIQPYSSDEMLLRVYRAIWRRHQLAKPVPLATLKPRVVIADDDPSALALLYSSLDSHGIECLCAKNGRETLALVRDLLPDLVILDVHMPVMNGFEALRALRHDPCTRNLKVILLTASRNVEDIETGYALGADGYFGKPFNVIQLTSRIKQLLNFTGQPQRSAAKPDPASDEPAIDPPPPPPVRPRLREEPKTLPELKADYLSRVTAGIAGLQHAASKGDFKHVSKFAHNLSGTGAAFGFPEITKHGRELETKAHAADAKGIHVGIASLIGILENLKVA